MHGKSFIIYIIILCYAQRDIEKALQEKVKEIEVLSSKLKDERKISKDLSTATTKLQKLLETTHKQLQKEKEKSKALSLQVRYM